MVFDFIVPVENKDEENEFIKKMYCLECKERGGCHPKHHFPIIEEGYQYDIVTCECSYCSKSFDVKFFNVDSYTNQTLKRILSNKENSTYPTEKYEE